MLPQITAGLTLFPLIFLLRTQCPSTTRILRLGSRCVHAENRCWRWPLWFRPCPTLEQESPVDHGTDGAAAAAAAARTAVARRRCALFRWDPTMHLHCWSSAHMDTFDPFAAVILQKSQSEQKAAVHVPTRAGRGVVVLPLCHPDNVPWLMTSACRIGWEGGDLGGGGIDPRWYRSVVGKWSAFVWKHGCSLPNVMLLSALHHCFSAVSQPPPLSTPPSPPPSAPKRHRNRPECRFLHACVCAWNPPWQQVWTPFFCLSPKLFL